MRAHVCVHMYAHTCCVLCVEYCIRFIIDVAPQVGIGHFRVHLLVVWPLVMWGASN